jgi:hypothetical protein
MAVKRLPNHQQLHPGLGLQRPAAPTAAHTNRMNPSWDMMKCDMMKCDIAFKAKTAQACNQAEPCMLRRAVHRGSGHTYAAACAELNRGNNKHKRDPTHLCASNELAVPVVGVWRKVGVLHCVTLWGVADGQNAAVCVILRGHPAQDPCRHIGTSAQPISAMQALLCTGSIMFTVIMQTRQGQLQQNGVVSRVEESRAVWQHSTGTWASMHAPTTLTTHFNTSAW